MGFRSRAESDSIPCMDERIWNGFCEIHRRIQAGDRDCIISTGRPVAVVARGLGMSEKTASRWVVDRRRQLTGEPDSKDGDRKLREAGKRIRELEMENAFLKKSRGLLRQGAGGTLARYRLMPVERAGSPVKPMARILGVGRSGSRSWPGKGCPEGDRSDTRDAVRRVRPGSDGRFGSHFVKCPMSEGHSRLTLYRVGKLMRELGIRGCTPTRASGRPSPEGTPIPGPIWSDGTSPAPSPPESSWAESPTCEPARDGSSSRR